MQNNSTQKGYTIVLALLCQKSGICDKWCQTKMKQLSKQKYCEYKENELSIKLTSQFPTIIWKLVTLLSDKKCQ